MHLSKILNTCHLHMLDMEEVEPSAVKRETTQLDEHCSAALMHSGLYIVNSVCVVYWKPAFLSQIIRAHCKV